ncbi:flavodoxin family protein [Candidatus Bathyarchaeota archaeon]|jgi:multimeric flavodoxin WrbA|nr:flavodoxin family protein [Candidatus Bathyarchaeota archaeon]
MVRIIGVQGSPRKSRNTEALLRHALAAAEEAGAETELVNLAELNIKPCIGCNTCVREKRCPLDDEDDMGAVKEALLSADGVVFASPSYFGAVPGLLKNVMDRSRSLKMDGHRLRDKVVSAVAVAGLRHGGAERVAESIMHFGLTHGMIAVGGCGNPLTEAHYGTASLQGDAGWRRVGDDEIGLSYAAGVGRRVAEVAAALKR